MRVALILVASLGGPVLLFFAWAWASAIKRERKLKGTLPAWQDLPWTNLLIVGLLLAIAGTLVLYFVDGGQGGLLGFFSPLPLRGRGRGRREAWEGEGFTRGAVGETLTLSTSARSADVPLREDAPTSPAQRKR